MSDTSDSKLSTRKWNTGNVYSKANYNAANKIIYNTKVLKSNLCDYNNPYILVRDTITVTAALETQLSFRNCATFTKCITKIDGTTIDDAENLELVMPMYNLIESSSNYSEKTGSFFLNDYGFILKMKQLILMLILKTLMVLSFSSIRLNY